MTKDELRRMLSLVDEKYIDEITESAPEIIEEFDEEEVEFSNVEEAPRQSWRIWAALAAAVVLCVPIGFSLAQKHLQMPEDGFSVGTEIQTDWNALVDGMTDEEVAGYFSEDSDTNTYVAYSVDYTYHIRTDAVPFASAYEGKALHISFQNEEAWKASVILTDDETGTMLTGEQYLEIELTNAAAQQTEIKSGYVYLPQLPETPFYGEYREREDGDRIWCTFRYQELEYRIFSNGMSRREILKLVYEIIDSGATPESLYALGQAEEERLAIEAEEEQRQEMQEQELHQKEIEGAERRRTWKTAAEIQLADLNETGFCTGMVPQITHIGDMRYYSSQKPTDNDSFGAIVYVKNSTVTWMHYIHVYYYDADYGALADFAYPPIEPLEWGMETISAEPYCTSHANGLNSYMFHVNWGNCMMSIEAQCTEEEMETYILALTDTVCETRGFVERAENVTEPGEIPEVPASSAARSSVVSINWDEANEVDFCKGHVPVVNVVGTMLLQSSELQTLPAEEGEMGRRELHFVNLYYGNTLSVYQESHFFTISFTDATAEELQMDESDVLDKAFLTDLNKLREKMPDGRNAYFLVDCGDFRVRFKAVGCTMNEVEDYAAALAAVLE